MGKPNILILDTMWDRIFHKEMRGQIEALLGPHKAKVLSLFTIGAYSSADEVMEGVTASDIAEGEPDAIFIYLGLSPSGLRVKGDVSFALHCVNRIRAEVRLKEVPILGYAEEAVTPKNITKLARAGLTDINTVALLRTLDRWRAQ